MNTAQAEQNCIKAAVKWANAMKRQSSTSEGDNPEFWITQFGYNPFDIAFEALSHPDWHNYLRLESDVREKLFKLATDTAILTWCDGVMPEPVVREVESVLIEVPLSVETKSVPVAKVEPVVEVKQDRVVEVQRERSPAGTKPTAAEKLLRMFRADAGSVVLGRAAQDEGGRVSLGKGGLKKWSFKDGSSVILTTNGAYRGMSANPLCFCDFDFKDHAWDSCPLKKKE
jgi:hypothetical protein